MKKRNLVLLSIVVLLLSPFVIFFFNLVTLNYSLQSSYDEYAFSMASIELNGNIFIDKQIADKIDTTIITTCLKDNEDFLNLKYKKPIKIIVCKDDTESGRIFHYFKTKGSGFAFSNNLIIVNYRNLIDLGYTFESIIRHETSHTLIKQNIDSFVTMIWTFSNNSVWFSEGLALYNQGLVIYTLDELQSVLNGYDLKYIQSSDNFFTVPQNYRNEYSVYYYFMKYLIEKYGEEKMIGYLNLMIQKFSKSNENFQKVFQSDIQSEINYFCGHNLKKKLIAKDEK